MSNCTCGGTGWEQILDIHGCVIGKRRCPHCGASATLMYDFSDDDGGCADDVLPIGDGWRYADSGDFSSGSEEGDNAADDFE